jgi:hypothetical protein
MSSYAPIAGRDRMKDRLLARCADVPSTRYTRRLSDHVLIAFHHACDQDDIVVARRLLKVLDFMARRPPPGLGGRERRAEESLVAAYERLWHLKHPEASAEALRMRA